MGTANSDTRAGAMAGLVAGAAYLGEMAIDLKAFRHNTDDLYLLGRMATSDKRFIRPVGLGVHLINSILFGVIYSRIAHDRLPGPPWLRGVTVANVENAALFPFGVFEQHHPGIRSGEIAPYLNKRAFLQNVARHVVFGAVLGVAYSRLRRRPVHHSA